MKIVSIKRFVLALTLSVASFITLPAYAWPDTDEMNMCGAAAKVVRSYAGDPRGWASRDKYISYLGSKYYYLANCPQSKATKNYKGKNWTPGAKMRAKTKSYRKMHKKHGYKHKQHKKHMRMHHAKHARKHYKMKKDHNPNHKNHADCVRTDALNNSGAMLKKANRRMQKVDHSFYRQAQAVLNMSKVKRVYKAHNPNHKRHADCIRTDGLNNSGAIVRVVRQKHY